MAKLRLEVAGPRGRAAFARQLGLAPSTYAYYESTRVPPPDVLVRIADLAGADLRWLLTGQPGQSGAVPAGHPAVVRAAALLRDHPGAARPLAAFLDLLAGAMAFPPKEDADQPPSPAAAPAEGTAALGRGIPVLGRTAAGVPQFWRDGQTPEGIVELGDLIAARSASAGQVVPASAQDESAGPAQTVRIVSLSQPDGSGACEYVAAESLAGRHPDAFAVRVDGDSMAPFVRHGELVVLSPSVPAADAAPAVVQLRGQIGVTCKLFRRDGETVHLIPINDRYAPESFPASDVVWALRVLARVRPLPVSPKAE